MALTPEEVCTAASETRSLGKALTRLQVDHGFFKEQLPADQVNFLDKSRPFETKAEALFLAGCKGERSEEKLLDLVLRVERLVPYIKTEGALPFTQFKDIFDTALQLDSATNFSVFRNNAILEVRANDTGRPPFWQYLIPVLYDPLKANNQYEQEVQAKKDKLTIEGYQDKKKPLSFSYLEKFVLVNEEYHKLSGIPISKPENEEPQNKVALDIRRLNPSRPVAPTGKVSNQGVLNAGAVGKGEDLNPFPHTNTKLQVAGIASLGSLSRVAAVAPSGGGGGAGYAVGKFLMEFAAPLVPAILAEAFYYGPLKNEALNDAKRNSDGVKSTTNNQVGFLGPQQKKINQYFATRLEVVGLNIYSNKMADYNISAAKKGLGYGKVKTDKENVDVQAQDKAVNLVVGQRNRILTIAAELNGPNSANMDPAKRAALVRELDALKGGNSTTPAAPRRGFTPIADGKGADSGKGFTKIP